MPTGLSPGKTQADSDWVVDFCNAREAWALTPPDGGKSMGEGVFVLHPDTGYTEHPELMAGGRYFTQDGIAMNFYSPKLRARDDLLGSGIIWFPSHGTSTASVMMSGEGHPNPSPPTAPEFPGYTETAAITGMAPKVKVLPCLVARSVILDERTDAALANAIYHAIGLNKRTNNNNIGVISISLGRPERSTEKVLKDALTEARKAGIVVCAAAGQGGTWIPIYQGPTYPGRDASTIGVAACDSQHQMLDNGRYGPQVNITAPGVDVWIARSERLNGTPVPRYFIESDGTGTSYATAIVAGACALWQAYHGRAKLLADFDPPNLFYLFKEVLKRSCDKRSGAWDTTKHGFGVLDAEALLKEPLPTKPEILALAPGG